MTSRHITENIVFSNMCTISVDMMLAGRSSCSTRRVLFSPAHFCYTAKTNWSLQMVDKAIGHKSPATLLSHRSLSLFSPKGDQQERRHWPKKKANKPPPASHPCKEKNNNTRTHKKNIRHNCHTSWQPAAFCHFKWTSKGEKQWGEHCEPSSEGHFQWGMRGLQQWLWMRTDVNQDNTKCICCVK